MKTVEMSRFDTRLPKEQKELFELAASLGGYRTLTEFVIASSQEKAKAIVADHQNLISSKKDAEVFFKELTTPSKPNKALKNAAKRFKQVVK